MRRSKKQVRVERILESCRPARQRREARQRNRGDDEEAKYDDETLDRVLRELTEKGKELEQRIEAGQVWAVRKHRPSRALDSPVVLRPRTGLPGRRRMWRSRNNGRRRSGRRPQSAVLTAERLLRESEWAAIQRGDGLRDPTSIRRPVRWPTLGDNGGNSGERVPVEAMRQSAGFSFKSAVDEIRQLSYSRVGRTR